MHLHGIAALAKSEDPVPHLPNVERGRKDERDEIAPSTTSDKDIGVAAPPSAG